MSSNGPSNEENVDAAVSAAAEAQVGLELEAILDDLARERQGQENDLVEELNSTSNDPGLNHVPYETEDEENSLTDLDIIKGVKEALSSDESPNGILPGNGMGDDIEINPSEPPLVMGEPDIEDDIIDGCWTEHSGGDEPKIMDKDEIASKPDNNEEVDEIINKPQSNDSGFYVGQDENPSVIDPGFNVNPEIEGLPEALSSILPGNGMGDDIEINPSEPPLVMGEPDLMKDTRPPSPNDLPYDKNCWDPSTWGDDRAPNLKEFMDDLIASSKVVYNPNEEHKDGEPTSTDALRNDYINYAIDSFAKKYDIDDSVADHIRAGIKSAMNDGDGLTREELSTILDGAGLMIDNKDHLAPTNNIAEGAGIKNLIEKMNIDTAKEDIQSSDAPDNIANVGIASMKI